MPINPLISLQSQAPDIGQTFSNALMNIGRVDAIRENRAGAAGRAQAQQTQIDQDRFSSVVNAAVQLNNLPDKESKMRFAETRRKQLQGAGLNTEDTDAFIGALFSSEEEAQSLLDTTIAAGQQSGILQTQPVPKATSVQQNLIAAGFTPGTPEFQSKLLELIEKPTGTTVNVGTDGFNVPPNFMINPDDPTGQSVVPIPGSKGGMLSGEGAKLSEIARGGLSAVESLVAGFESGGITQETMAAAAAIPDMFNFFKSANVQEYETVSTNLIDMIGRLRSGGAISTDEESRFAKLIPKFGDKDSQVKSKLNGLKSMFTNLQSKLSLTPIKRTDAIVSPLDITDESSVSMEQLIEMRNQALQGDQ